MEPQKESWFYKWLYAPVIVPVILLLVGAVITGKVIIQITGFQLSIGITFAMIIFIFLMMGISFILGIGYVLTGVFVLFTKTKTPLVYRIAGALFYPLLIIYNRWQEAYFTRRYYRKDKES